MNYLQKSLLITALSCALPTLVLAKQAENPECPNCLAPETLYLTAFGGASFSNEADLDVLTGANFLNSWDPADQGYNSDLGTSEVLGAAMGYVITPWVSIEIEYSRRDGYEYEKFQTTNSSPLSSKTRYFDLENDSFMANALFYGSGMSKFLAYHNQHFVIDPFIEAGIGVGINTVSDFHSIQTSSGLPFSVMEPNTELSFAYQLGVGLQLRTDKRFGFSVQYRYLNAGDFESNNYVEASALGNGTVVSPWTGKLSTNEVLASIDFFF